ncbi:unnamed protein product [Colias eurytheme]|nr:unnamed protein product [Colias eurytheme]
MEQNSRVIVMLNGSEEESQETYAYLSPSQIEVASGDFVIKQTEINLEPSYTETVLIITHSRTGESKKISHLKYLNWPEHQFPDEEDILKFVVMMNIKKNNFSSKQMRIANVCQVLLLYMGMLPSDERLRFVR